MSRLDSFIRRLEAQKACLDEAARLSAVLDGPALEIGLGNGRTYDHLRELMPEREIWVIEREPNPHPLSMPPHDRLILGDLEEVLPRLSSWLSRPPVLVHSDIGTGDAGRNARVASLLSRLLPPVIAQGAIIASDQELTAPELLQLPLPTGVAAGRYFLYRRR